MRSGDIKKFIEIFQEYENFVTCEKLFVMLREKISYARDLCIVIIEIIKFAASRLVEDKVRRM